MHSRAGRYAPILAWTLIIGGEGCSTAGEKDPTDVDAGSNEPIPGRADLSNPNPEAGPDSDADTPLDGEGLDGGSFGDGGTLDIPLLAFPGAEGYGAETTGGRGGAVIAVTTLEDSGPGSLRAALTTTGPRTVVFRRAGTIALDSTIVVTDPFVTIAGQTAPGGGIAIRHSGVAGFGSPLISVRTHDVVIRHVRFRRGPSAEGECCGDNIGFHDARRVIMDHVSLSWSTDELMDGWPVHELTVQNSLLAEALAVSSHEENGVIENHAMGPLIGNASDSVSFIRNVFAHNKSRNPQINPTEGGTFQVLNNVVYNTCSAILLLSNGPRANYDAVGNLILEGPDTCGSGRASILVDDDVRVFVQDNLTPYRSEGDDEWLATAFFRVEPPADRALKADLPFTEWPSLLSASALEEALLPEVGATRPRRDAVDTRIVQSIRDRTGTHINDPSEVGGWPDLTGGVPYPDADQDGSDDLWEVRHGFDPSDTSDQALDRDGDGYTNLEEFLNETLP